MIMIIIIVEKVFTKPPLKETKFIMPNIYVVVSLSTWITSEIKRSANGDKPLVSSKCLILERI